MTDAKAAHRVPDNLDGLDAAWSTLVNAADADGISRTWQVLDSGEPSGPARPTIVCVHGNPTWSYLWRNLISALSPQHRVVAIDQLDMGYSERTGTERRLERRIDDLDAVVAELRIDGPIIVVAHDWGGPVSLGWALRHVERLAGVVLANTAVTQPSGSPAPSIIRLVRSPAILRTACVRTRSFIDGALAMANPRLPRAVWAGFQAPYKGSARREAIATFVEDIPLSDSHPSNAMLMAIADGIGPALTEVPVLLAWGPSDPVFSDLYLHDFEDRLPNADVHRFIGASHLVPEHPDFVPTVSSWISTRVMGIETITPTETTTNEPAQLTEQPPTEASPNRRPLWHAIEQRRNDPDLAIAELDSYGTSVSFAELHQRVQALAAGLLERGIKPGNRVALMILPGIDLASALYACWRIGAVAVIADSGLGARGLSMAMRTTDPDYLIGIPKATAAARVLRWPGEIIATASFDDLCKAGNKRLTQSALPEIPGSDDVAAIVFTSGSTGPAKGVRYLHRQLEAQRDAIVSTYDITAADSLVAAFAPFALYGPAMGITSAVPDMDLTKPATLRAVALADAANRIDASLVFASPAALKSVVSTTHELSQDQRKGLENVRLLLSAGAPVSPQILRSAAELLGDADAHTPYGMTECLPVTDINLVGLSQAGVGNGVCVGFPVTGAQVAIAPVDSEGNVADELVTTPENTGEICVAAAHRKDGYERLWATESASSNLSGWHRTGDVGHLDHEGRLWVEGRLGHIIVTSNGVVTPVTLEQQAETLPEVDLSAAVGVGPAGVQHAVAIVTGPDLGKAGLASLELADLVRSVVEVPLAAVLVVSSMPTDSRHNSKIDRSRLATWAEGVLAGGRVGKP